MSIQKKVLYTILVLLPAMIIQVILKDLKMGGLVSVAPLLIGVYYLQTRIWSKKK
jgi:hypothetical protein